LLTGEFVFNVESVLEIYEKQLTESPVPPSQRTRNQISPELETIILRCLDREPNVRPQSVGELRASLLASPHALDWVPEARAAWWAEYHSREKQAPAQTEQPKSASSVPTVKIDFATRMK
jgi:eukaryotic-like serine/threonine-protein kinase